MWLQQRNLGLGRSGRTRGLRGGSVSGPLSHVAPSSKVTGMVARSTEAQGRDWGEPSGPLGFILSVLGNFQQLLGKKD